MNQENKNQESENRESIQQQDGTSLDSLILDSSEFEKVPATLLGLVSRYSPSGQEAEVVPYFLERVSELGFEKAYTDRTGNGIGIMGGGPQQVVLLGHIDTVPGRIPLKLDGDGRFYGRGTVDAKGPLAAFVDAVSQVGPLDGWQFVVIGAVEEEHNSRGAQEIMHTFSPEFGIIGEPSSWDRVTLGYKGFVRAEVEIRRPSAHGASEQLTASEQAVALWEKITRSNAQLNLGKPKIFDQVSTRLKGLQTGENGHVQWARLQVEARLPPGFLPEDWIKWLQGLVGLASVEPGGYWVPAHRSEKNSPLVRSFLRAIRAQGGSPRFVVKSGTADMNTVAQTWSCPLVAYGPGDSTLDHTPEEHIFLDEYQRAVETLRTALIELTKRK